MDKVRRAARRPNTTPNDTAPPATEVTARTKVRQTRPDAFQGDSVGVTHVAALTAALAEHGTTAVAARVGLARALSTALVLPTSVEAETQASTLFAALRKGKAVQADLAVAAALAHGPLAVAELSAALAWRIGAAAADGATQALVEQAGVLLDAIVDCSIAALATTRPKDICAAVQTNVALSALLSRGQTLESAYLAPADFTYQNAFDAFTNEQGLPDATRKLPETGGATVGVSGGVLHLATHTRAALAVVADTNPEIRDFVLTLGTAAMVLTAEVERNGGSDVALVDTIQNELLGATRGGPVLIDKLRAAGLPEPLATRAPAMLRAIYAPTGDSGKMVWLAPSGTFPAERFVRGAGGTVAEVAANFRHLATLARNGALVAPVVDLGDGVAFERIGHLLAHKAAPLKTLHLSNALDYVFDPRGVITQLQVLPGAADATVTSCTAGRLSAVRRIGDWYEPAVNPMGNWLGDDGIAIRLKPSIPTLVQAAWRAGLPLAAFSASAKDDAHVARDALARAVAEHYADPKRALLSLLHMLPSHCWPDGEQRLRALGVKPPRDPETARAMVRALLPLLTQH